MEARADYFGIAQLESLSDKYEMANEGTTQTRFLFFTASWHEARVLWLQFNSDLIERAIRKFVRILDRIANSYLSLNQKLHMVVR